MMLLSDVVKELALVSRVDGPEDRQITGGYASDLLSDVLAHAKDGYIWVTNQKHQNCVAVASLLGITAVVIAGGISPDENTLEKAAAERVPIYTTDMSAFQVVGRLYELGVQG